MVQNNIQMIGGHDPRQVSNIPLTYVSMPTSIRVLKGCAFIPPCPIARDTLYFIVVSNQPKYIPQPGWYDVPEKGHLTWIARFLPVQLSRLSITGARCWVFEAIEGTPPVDALVNALKPKGGLLI